MNQRGYTIVELIIAVLMLAGVVVVGGLLYVVFHFIAKFW